MSDTIVETERLLLRGWREADAAPFQAICSDPEVMRHLGPVMDMPAAHAVVARMQAMQADVGYCFWAMERKADGAMMGFCGVKPGAIGTPIEGRIEIGWRMGQAFWGQGYAREAAQASLDWSFAHIPADSIWAMTTPDNVRSWGLMERIGMARRRDLDFDHPANPVGDPLRAHITYWMERA